MSNKDNWDDESGDEEEQPILKEGGLLRFNLDALESEAPMEEPNEEDPPEEGVVGGNPLEEEGVGGNPLEEYTDDEWGCEGGDPLEDEDGDDDYEDELDDYDKKLGRYVSCR